MKKILVLLVLLSASFSNAQWQITAGVGTANGNTLFALNDTIFAGTDFGVYKTTNNGTLWTVANDGFGATRRVKNFDFNGGKVWCATEGSGLFFSTNFGANWIREYGSYFTNTFAVAAKDQYVLTSSGTYVYYTTNLGANWIIMDQGPEPWGYSGIIIKDNFVYSADLDGIYLSFLGGTSWNYIIGNLTGNSMEVNEIRYANDKIYIATEGGVWTSSNNGSNWINLNPSLTSTSIWSLEISGPNIIIGTETQIHISNNNGTTWSNVSAGLPANPRVTEIALNSQYAFAMLQNGFVYRRPLSELIGIQPISSEIPRQFSISQNYPNPFNPVTNINFEVKEKGFVKLSIFNSIGQEITQLVNQELNAGTYKSDWNASNYPSGVYYYKITAGSFSETKKMTLLK